MQHIYLLLNSSIIFILNLYLNFILNFKINGYENNINIVCSYLFNL